MAPTSDLPEWLVSALKALQAGDVDGWMKMYAADPVHEFPFAPAGWVTKLEGRHAIASYMAHLLASIRLGSFSDVRARQVGNELIVEATGHHRRVSDNAPWELSYVWFITLREGRVTHFRDYMNPLQLSVG
ncbi:ketosteroid isomerase-like protein [Paraburkholderia sp. UCT70]|uniref:nuclear transport factor 2 family protein n=1 Tax=Paraburkholderia sp. UCT70 TaxID=2991068 RepID=UPI003D256CC7